MAEEENKNPKEEEQHSPPNPNEKQAKQQEPSSYTTVGTGEFVVSGPNANIQVNKGNVQDFMELYQRAFNHGQTTATNFLQGKAWTRDLGKELRAKKEQKDTEDLGGMTDKSKGVKQMETLEDVAVWYEKFSDDPYVQCTIQTMSSLHGASATDIARLMKTLHVQVAQEQSNNNEMASQKARPPLDRELYQHTHIEKKRINGISRLFWKDLDGTGQQRFTGLVLRYLAEEAVFSGLALTTYLKKWAENESGDCAWRAARALGIILFWQSSTQDLWHLANEWADSSSTSNWRNAASLLNGAYSVEWTENEQKASNPRLSDILRLLNQWIERSQEPTEWCFGCAAAETYGLLDARNPDIALDGLEKLLRLPGSGISNNWQSISVDLFIVCISNYVSIAWSYHIRNVLERLSHHARTLVYQQQQPEHVEDALRYQGQCDLQMEAILTIFFLVAAFSFTDSDTQVSYSLIEPLPPQPEVLDEQGRDILLAGILSTVEKAWQEAVSALLCAAFFVQKEEQAFYIMRQWTNTIEKITQENQELRQQMQTTYDNFIVNLYHTIEAWEVDPDRAGFGLVPASATFRYYLSFWCESADWNGTTNSAFIRTFAKEILAQLEG